MKFTKLLLSKVILRLSVVIFITTILSFAHSYFVTKDWAKKNLTDYTKARRTFDSHFFNQSKKNHEFLRDEFLNLRKSITKKSDILKKYPDGSFRSDYTKFDDRKNSGIFHSKLFIMTDYDWLNLQTAQILTEKYGPAFLTDFPSTYFSFPSNSLVLFAPGYSQKWIFDTPANQSLNEENWFYLGQPTSNPERKTLWTEPYFDPNPKKWMISSATPIWMGNDYVGTIGQDVLLDDLIQRTNNESLPETYNYVVSNKGYLIAHKVFQNTIDQKGHAILIDETSDNYLKSHFLSLKELIKSGTESMIFESSSEIYEISDLGQSGMYLVSVLPKKAILQQSLKSIWVVALLSVLTLLFEVIILIRTLTENFEQPIGSLLRAVMTNAKGRFDLIRSKETYRDDELGELARTFNKMVLNIHEKDKALENYNLKLSEEITTMFNELEEQKVLMIHQSRLSAVGEMAGSIAHEINTPLAIIKGSSAIIQRELQQEPLNKEKLSSHVEKIDKTSEKINKIVKGLKGFIRNDMDETREPTSPNEIVNEAVELCADKLKNNGVFLHIDQSENLPNISVNQMQITQIILNLISNAIDAFPIDLKDKSISINISSNPDFVFFKVHDNGSGIPAEIQENIFKPFFTTKQAGKGTGLGLSISQVITSRHKGTLTVSSEPGNTTFELKLPIKES